MKKYLTISFWQSFIRGRRDLEESRTSLALEGEVLRSLHHLADHEKRTAREIANELLAQAISTRQVAIMNLEIWRALTPREQQVSALICLDFTNRQIAARLNISPQTVKSHVRNILNKTGLGSKAELRDVLADWDFSEYEVSSL